MAGNASRENGKKGGRPKGYAALQAEMQRANIAAELSKHMKPIIATAIKGAIAGDKDDRNWLTDQAYGKPTQPTTIGDPNGDPLFKPSDADRALARKALKALIT